MKETKLLRQNCRGGSAALAMFCLTLATAFVSVSIANANESATELSVDVPTKIGITVASGDQQCNGEGTNSLCLEWSDNMTAKGSQFVEVASNNATGYTLTVDTGDDKLSSTDPGTVDKISFGVSPESFKTDEFADAETHEFKYQARAERRRQYITAGDYAANVVYSVTANDAYGNAGTDDKCSPNNNPMDCAYEFAYTGGTQKFTAPYDGKYKLEVWGASGGDTRFTDRGVATHGGSGGYSVGAVSLIKGEVLHIQVGGAGGSSSFDTTDEVYSSDDNAGYNGGGVGHEYWSYTTPRMFNSIMGGGGGATSVTLTDGLLSEHINDRQNVLIVAGAGSGAILHTSYPAWSANGGNGGGYIGGDEIAADDDNEHCYARGFGATQDAPGKQESCTRYGEGTKFSPSGFGYALNCTNADGTEFNVDDVIKNPAYSNGGSGWYGGGDGVHGPSGGGSGYLKSSLLDISSGELKHMAGYDVETSNDANTRTISVTCAKEKPTADCAKFGNGYARITYLGQ